MPVRFSCFSRETARKSVHHNLPELAILSARLNDAVFNACCIAARVCRHIAKRMRVPGLTTSRSWAYRLLMEGLGHWLRPVRGYLTGEIAACALESEKKAAREWLSELPRQRMWLFRDVDLEGERIQDLTDPQFVSG